MQIGKPFFTKFFFFFARSSLITSDVDEESRLAIFGFHNNASLQFINVCRRSFW